MLRRVIAVMSLAVAGIGVVCAAEPVPKATCVSTRGTCLAYIGKDTESMLRYVVNGCRGPGNTWSTRTRCPADNRLGVCKNEEGKPNEMWTVVYKTASTSAAQAASQCERDLKGKWYAK